jgi:hypothetical protein
MKRSDLFFYLLAGAVAIVYFIGEATGYLFFAMLIILPVWVWLIAGPSDNI